MTDPHPLTPAERKVMKRSLVALQDELHPGWPREDDFEVGFLAGLRYQDEVSDEEVEAAARALFNRDWLGAKVQPAWDETPPENAQSYREEALTALQAAKGVGGDG